MQEIHDGLKKSLGWYAKWHNHPRHQHAHWFGLFVFVFLLLITSFLSTQIVYFYAESRNAQAQTTLPAPNHPMLFGYYYANADNNPPGYNDFLDEVSGYNNAQIIVTGR